MAICYNRSDRLNGYIYKRKGIYFMICPKCKSNHVTTQVVTETHSHGKTKGFGWFKSCIGFFLFNIPGILCGLCGMGKGKTRTTTRTRTIHVCQNCGNTWYD